MLRFISFGSGSSGNCYCLYTDNDSLLIDVGVGVRSLKKSFHNYGVPLQNVHHILITHDHADHVKSVGSISRDFKLPVYATSKVHKGIEQNYCVRCKILPEYKNCIEVGVPFVLGDFTVIPFQVPHDSQDCVGYRVEAEGIVFVLMTDVGHITDEMKGIINSANYLVLEANHDDEMLKNGPYPEYLKKRIKSQFGHLSNRECGLALAENATPNLKHVWLCHLSEENNHPELARKTIEQILRDYGIVVGVDFKMDILKRKVPSEVQELL